MIHVVQVLTDTNIGGAGKYLLNYLKNFDRSSFRVTVVLPENSKLADTMALGSTVSPKELCCNSIVRYVRAMQNQTGAAVSVHTIADGQSEAVEFLVDESTKKLRQGFKGHQAEAQCADRRYFPRCGQSGAKR